MKIFELLTEDQDKMPHLYLDMDGVQADFFGEWARMHGMDHYKAIPHFEEAIEELAHSNPGEVFKFFDHLRPLQGGKIIVDWLHKNKIPYTILSAPLRGPFAKYSIEGKKSWLDKHNPNTSGTAIFTSDKYKYALQGGRPNVLVDDYGKYINEWVAAGGIGIKHEDDDTPHTIDRLEKIYSKYINGA